VGISRGKGSEPGLKSVFLEEPGVDRGGGLPSVARRSPDSVNGDC
jgi:hypothetical protein